MDLEALRVLDAIERRGSFAAAARELGRVPSAITYTVRQLEDALDVLLFDRRARRARFTPAGRELLEQGRRLLADANAVETRVRRIAGGWEAELAIALDAIVPASLLWPLAAAFYQHCAREEAAHTRLLVTREVLGGTWDALAEGRVALAIGASGEPPPGGGWRLRPMAAVAMVFAVAPPHPLASASAPLADADIARHRGVVASDSSRRLPPRTVGWVSGQDTLQVPDLEAKLAAQVAGLGCGWLPYPLAADAIAAGALVVKSTETPRPDTTLHLAWREARPGRALAWWIDAAGRHDWRFLAANPTPGRAGARSATRSRRRPLSGTGGVRAT
jgi:DNA-binding transcriptional LysR family regulator